MPLRKIDYKGWLLLVFSIAVCFVGLEFGLRYSSVTDRLGYHRSETISELLTSVPAKRPGEIRIAGIGDSFTIFRDGEGRNYLRYAEELARSDGRNLSIMNLGLAGANLRHYFSRLARAHDAVKPDIVTIGLYLGDDIGPPDSPGLRDLYESGRLADPDGGKSSYGVTGKFADLLRNSILINFIYRRAKVEFPSLRSGFFEGTLSYLQKETGRTDAFVRRGLERADPKLVDLARADAINGWDLANAVISPRSYVELYEAEPNTRADRALAATLRDLDFIAAWCRERDIELAVVLLHPGIIVNSRYQSYYRRLGFELPALDPYPPPLVKRLAGFLTEKRIPFVDTLPTLRPAEGTLYIENDVHLNSDGQRIVGALLYEMLKKSGTFGRTGG